MLKRWATWPESIRWVVGVFVAVAAALAIAWVLFVPAADWLATHDVGPVKGALRTSRVQTARDAARGRLLTFAAGLFAAGALVYTSRNFMLSRRVVELSEQGQVTDRYTKAIEQLSSDKLDARIGGIYALERVAHDSYRDHPTVIEVLAAFVREHSREQWLPAESGAATPNRIRSDIQAAVSVIGRRNARHDPDARIDLSGANLFGAHLVFADLEDVDLTGAHLDDADLLGANLSYAILNSAYLIGANLDDVTLTGTSLKDADLSGAHVGGVANPGSADLAGANLDGTFWPIGEAVPDGWQRNPATDHLVRLH